MQVTLTTWEHGISSVQYRVWCMQWTAASFAMNDKEILKPYLPQTTYDVLFRQPVVLY